MSLGSNIQIPLTSNLISHKHLHHLDVRMFAVGEWWYDNIESLLSMVPDLEYLTFYIDRKRKQIKFPFNAFGGMLTQYLPHLHYFRANILLDKSLSSSKLGIIKQYHSLFTNVQIDTITLDKNFVSHLYISSDSPIS
jgi:hypothetical protein